jgi:GNAT superfamily N-acetyltransferase
VPELRRQGIGRALVAAVALRASREGRGYLWWKSRVWNEEAKQFYTALGATTEPVNAHALTFAAFDAMAKEGERLAVA